MRFEADAGNAQHDHHHDGGAGASSSQGTGPSGIMAPSASGSSGYVLQTINLRAARHAALGSHVFTHSTYAWALDFGRSHADDVNDRQLPHPTDQREVPATYVSYVFVPGDPHTFNKVCDPRSTYLLARR